MKDQVLFPKIEVREKGFLQVSDIHTIYWERSGNPKGKKILVIHGGPGGGSQPRYRRYFDPDKFDIIQFDQRGCGSSTPFSELKENTTNHLVDDIEKLRILLKIDTWHLFGGSWGPKTLQTSAKYLFLKGSLISQYHQLNDWSYFLLIRRKELKNRNLFGQIE